TFTSNDDLLLFTQEGGVPCDVSPFSHTSGVHGGGRTSSVGRLRTCAVPAGQTSLRKSSVTFRKMSLASVSPTVTRTPSPANGRTTTPACSHACANGIVRSPSRNHTKLAWVSGTFQPWARNASITRLRS